ncbi:metalloregulator ArsR/SmtB family transcription factor [Sulfuricurvum sp.]|uniref:ArsR/SmtB family transcription factor n=1 Tax=Sulfuricurvum sp. TaxID=2025608 RepID=UPI0025D463EB|nr:metalloregulator ArsR/SmtB family transcription factor [Sulfuricurvum sp.]
MSFIDKRKMSFDEKVDIYKALGNKTRLEIFEQILSNGDKSVHKNGMMCITEIAALFTYSMPTISAHIDILRKAGLIMSFKDGKKIYVDVDIEKCKKLYDAFSGSILSYEEKKLSQNSVQN